MRLRLRLIDYFHCFFIFLSFLLSDVNDENLFQFSQELLKLGPRNLVYIWTLRLGSLLFFSLNLSIFLSLQGQIVSQFSHELCKLQSSNLTCMWRLSNCIIGSRLRHVVLILFLFIYLFIIIFSFCYFFLQVLSFPLLGVHNENLCHSFFKNCANHSLQTWHTYGELSGGIMGLRLILIFCLYPFLFRSFPILHANFENLCHSFLKNYLS